MAVPTADRASSTGTPAAMIAPKVSSRMPSVIGRLSFSARMKSSSTWPLMAWSIDALADLADAQARVVGGDRGRGVEHRLDAGVGDLLRRRTGRLPDVELHRHHRRAAVVGADQPADVGDLGQRREPLAQLAGSGAGIGVRELLTARRLDEHPLGEVGRVARLLDGEVGPAGRPGAHLAVGEQPGAGRTAADDGASDEQHPQQQCLPAVPDAPAGQPLGGAGAAAGRWRGRAWCRAFPAGRRQSWSGSFWQVRTGVRRRPPTVARGRRRVSAASGRPVVGITAGRTRRPTGSSRPLGVPNVGRDRTDGRPTDRPRGGRHA